jgi:hypothetical protein
MRKAEAKEFYAAGVVWNTWADYWWPKVAVIPPLVYLRVGGGEDYIFVSGVSEADLDGFIQAVKETPDLKFFKQGEWWLPTHRWFGTWTVFSAQVKAAFIGFERPIFASEEAFDFDNSGDPRLKSLRSDKGQRDEPS